MADIESWPKNKWGIPEPPKGGHPRLEALDEESDLDLFIVPGLAFDKERGRLGQGAGFYDRYLAVALDMRKVDGSFSGATGPLEREFVVLFFSFSLCLSLSIHLSVRQFVFCARAFEV